MEKNMSDPWKRPTGGQDRHLDELWGYEQQLELQLNKTVESTPEQVKEWQEKELDWWAEKQLSFVAIASIIQLSALGFMFLVMFLIKVGVK